MNSKNEWKNIFPKRSEEKAMQSPYKSKFQESYDMDAFNAFLEKEVPGFGSVGPEDKKRANEYFRQLIKTLQQYISDNESEMANEDSGR